MTNPIGHYESIPIFLNEYTHLFTAQVGDLDEKSAPSYDALTKKIDADLTASKREAVPVEVVDISSVSPAIGKVCSFTDGGKPRFNGVATYQTLYKYTESDLVVLRELGDAYSKAHAAFRGEQRRLREVLSPVTEADVYPGEGNAAKETAP